MMNIILGALLLGGLKPLIIVAFIFCCLIYVL